MATYFIKIRPTSSYYFGADSNNESGVFGNSKTYFLKGLMFPQQTSLFGLLRYILLLDGGIVQEGMPAIPRELRQKAASLIGERSFRPDEKHYGVIKQLFPVFITSTNANQYPVLTRRWAEAILSAKDNTIRFVHWNREMSGFDCIYNGHAVKKIALIENYSEKDIMLNVVVNGEGKMYLLENDLSDIVPEICVGNVRESTKSLDSILTNWERVGIRKGEKGATEEEAYYKQVFYRFNNEFCFGSYVDLDDSIEMDQKMFYCTFGKERQMMKVSFTKCSNEIEAPDRPKRFAPSEMIHGADSSKRILLLSDTVVAHDYLSAIDLSITQAKSFGYIKSSINDRSYKGSVYRGNEPKQQHVLSAGSVLWVSDLENWESKLDKNYSVIGMNMYTTISEQSKFSLNKQL